VTFDPAEARPRAVTVGYEGVAAMRTVLVAIAATLRGGVASVECRPARGLRDSVAGYDLVVLGAPLYSGRWHRDAHRFLKRHRRELAEFAAFGMGPRSDESEAWRRSRAQLDRALARHPDLRPVSVALFGGVDPPGKRTHRDLRAWAAINGWADRVTGRVGWPTG
jgi:menaquinone-dependent protoporphyrinogen oxidase